MSDKTKLQVNKYIIEPKIVKEMEGKVLGLSKNVLDFRFAIASKHNKTCNYFKILSGQIYEMKKEIDYIRTYLHIGDKANQDKRQDKRPEKEE